MTTICVPTDDTAAALADLPEPVEVLVWDGSGQAPPGIERVEFFVASYPSATDPSGSIGRMPDLRVIQLQSAGVESWLELVPPGVVLCGGRGVHGGSTAELAIAGILSHLRELPHYAGQQQAAQWQRRDSAGLRGRSVLVLGAGDIGRRVADVARVFDAEVTLVARHERAGVHPIADVARLLPTADIVVIALPNTPETSGLVDAAFLAALPDGALVVNVARGPLLDTAALLAELEAGRLYAFLDVFETEPLPADHPLWSAPNVVITPHVGGGTVGWQQLAAELIREQVLRFLRDEPLANVVEAGY